MVSRILAFRPASVVQRLAPRSGACPLSARELIGTDAGRGFVLPIVQAPIVAVARGALVAAKELQAVLGLSLPPGVPAARWFDGVARAADEVAAGLPIVLSAELAIEGEGPTQLERASREAWELVDAGVTHLAFDVGALAPEERARVLGEVARASAEGGASVEAVVPLGEGAQAATRAAAMFEELARQGCAPDAAGVRCPAPRDDDEARLQAAALARMSQGLGGVPVVRRGGVTPRLLALLRGSPVKACEDGGAVAARALSLVPVDLAAPEAEGAPSRATRLERAAAALTEEGTDRVEASAYVDAMELLERLGARGSAPSLSRALERRLGER
jgi:hypothetical protein